MEKDDKEKKEKLNTQERKIYSKREVAKRQRKTKRKRKKLLTMKSILFNMSKARKKRPHGSKLRCQPVKKC